MNVPSLKPLHASALVELARRHGRIVTVEDHVAAGGLGSIVAEILSQRHPTRQLMIAVEGFGQSGSPSDLYDHYGLAASKLVPRIHEFVTG